MMIGWFCFVVEKYDDDSSIWPIPDDDDDNNECRWPNQTMLTFFFVVGKIDKRKQTVEKMICGQSLTEKIIDDQKIQIS